MILLTGLFLLGATAVYAGDGRPVSSAQLPQQAQQFIRQHFPKSKIALTKVDRGLLDTEYEVVFADGSKAEFAKDGEWKEVVCRKSAVPAGILPAKIARKIAELYPNGRVVEIDRDSREYEVKLSDGTELTFDSAFELVDIDD